MSVSNQPISYGDTPIRSAAHDWLDRTAACAALGNILHAPLLDMPLTIGIYGDWAAAIKAVQQEFAKGKDVEDALRLFEAKYAEEYREHIQSLEQFRTSIHGIIQSYINETDRRLFIFIDDLDRCMSCCISRGSANDLVCSFFAS